jgi:membrane protease YdiL (CAAX protease family)
MAGDWPPPPPTYLPPPRMVPVATEPLEYHLVHKGGLPGWWRPVVGMIVLLLLMFVAAQIVWTIPFMVGFALAGRSVLDGMREMVDFTDPTPLGLAYLNLVLATAIPVAWLVTRVFHGLRPRWLSSVLPRLRWGYFLVCLGLSVLALVAMTAVALLLPAEADSGATGDLNAFTSTTRDFLLVIALLTPLQAAGEEYAFRGYLTQAFGGLFGNKVVAVLGPALLFGLAHGVGQSIPVFFDRFAFGVVAGILVIVTGGLEAGIAMHVLNNFLAYGFALAFGSMSDALNPTGGSWWMIPTTLTQSVVYLALAWWVARRMGLATRADPAVLAASRGLVYRVPSALPPAPQQ